MSNNKRADSRADIVYVSHLASYKWISRYALYKRLIRKFAARKPVFSPPIQGFFPLLSAWRGKREEENRDKTFPAMFTLSLIFFCYLLLFCIRNIRRKDIAIGRKIPPPFRGGFLTNIQFIYIHKLRKPHFFM